MRPDDCAKLLAKASSFDNRKPDPLAPAAWAETLDERMSYDDARALISTHYRASTDWLMPKHLNDAYRLLRAKRISDAAHGYAPLEAIEDPGLWHRTYLRAIGDGASEDQAVAVAYTAVKPAALIERDVQALITNTPIKEN